MKTRLFAGIRIVLALVLVLGILPVQRIQATTNADSWKVVASMPTAVL